MAENTKIEPGHPQYAALKQAYDKGNQPRLMQYGGKNYRSVDRGAAFIVQDVLAFDEAYGSSSTGHDKIPVIGPDDAPKRGRGRPRGS